MTDVGVSRTASAQSHAPLRETSGWAIGWTFFAMTMMILIGSFHAIVGPDRDLGRRVLRRDS